jgi:hypothetical protein
MFKLSKMVGLASLREKTENQANRLFALCGAPPMSAAQADDYLLLLRELKILLEV